MLSFSQSHQENLKTLFECRLPTLNCSCNNKISPKIAKQNTRWRDSIPAKVRLAVTLRFLATGDSYRSLHYLFKISSQIISEIIPDVCLALNEALKDLIKVNKTLFFHYQILLIFTTNMIYIYIKIITI